MNCKLCNKIFPNNRERARHDNSPDKYCLNKHKIVEYHDNKYVVMDILSKGNKFLCVIDYDDFDKCKCHWNLTQAGYVMDLYKRNVYLHHIIMNGQLEENKTVDHINRNTLDNRKANFRIIDQTHQNYNQNKKKRRKTYPKLVKDGIKDEDLPRCVSFSSKEERFSFELKKNGKKIKTIKGTRQSLPNLRIKLNRLIKRIKEEIEKDPKLFEYYQMFGELTEEGEKLQKEYEEIISL
jgi:hypothetical protein